MSSLAGALDGYSTSSSYHPYKGPDDVDMPGENQSSSANDDPEDTQDQDEEMTDLFGNDNDVEELKAERSVPPFFCYRQSEETAFSGSLLHPLPLVPIPKGYLHLKESVARLWNTKKKMYPRKLPSRLKRRKSHSRTSRFLGHPMVM